MIGPLLIAVSWLLLKIEGKGLRVLGFNAPGVRLRQFVGGWLVAGAAVAAQQLGRALVAGVSWQLNPDFTVALLLEHLRFNINSVLYEELLFRGYLLYQAIRWLGVWRGVGLGAAAFGVYHWFSYGVLGNPVMMAFIFVYTGAFGLMLGLAFAQTKSVAAPIGLHLGWNMVSQIVFSSGPLGAALLVPNAGPGVIEVGGLAALLLNIGVPLLLVGGVSAWLMRGKPNDGTGND